MFHHSLGPVILCIFRFTVDSETADPIDVQTKQMRETNSMVEEFMLVRIKSRDVYYLTNS